jgi:hypothetical protein
MNWDAIAAASEFVAAIAVVISLIYIALQVRSGASAFKTSLRDSTFHSLMEINYALAADESLAWVFQQGASDWDLLEERELARALQMMYSFFKMFENMYLHYLEGLVEEKMWASNKQVLFAYGAQPGAQRYLSQRMPSFVPEYQKLLQAIEPPAIAPISDLLKDHSGSV